MKVVEGEKSSVQRGGGGGGEGVELEGALFDVLDEKPALVLGRLAVLGAHDAGGPVQVQHVHQLLLLLLQLLDLSFQLRVNALQLLRLLRTRQDSRSKVSAARRFGPKH